MARYPPSKKEKPSSEALNCRNYKRFSIFIVSFLISEFVKVLIPLVAFDFDITNFYPQTRSMANEYLKSLLSKFSSKESLFANAIFTENKEVAKRIAYELYKKSPHYLLFYYILNRKESKSLILKLISNLRDIDLNLVYLLLKLEDFNHEDFSLLQSRIFSDSSIGLCIEKQMFLKKYEKVSDLDEVEKNQVAIELTTLINKIDDFSLYDFAIKNEIQLIEDESGKVTFKENNFTVENNSNINNSTEIESIDTSNSRPNTEKKTDSDDLLRNSINMNWYRIIQNKDFDCARRMILLSTNFCDIKKILEYCPLEDTESPTHNILIKYLKGDDPRKLLESSFNHLFNENSFISIKVLLALLIATKDEKLLLLALQISESAKFEENYEIGLINLFLCRYFLLFAKIRRGFQLLDIKNIQMHNLAYIWSDPMILMNVKLTDEILLFKREISNTQSSIEKMLITSLDNGKVAVAYSLIELRESLKNSAIVNEINSRKIISTSPFSMFSNFLGESCSFLFDKLIVTDRRTVQGIIPTIRTTPAHEFSESVFENDFLNLTDPNLIYSIQKNLSCFK